MNYQKNIIKKIFTALFVTGTILFAYISFLPIVSATAVDDSVWVGNNNSNTVSRINKANNAVIATISVGTYPYAIAVDSDSVWVSNFYSNTVSRINKANNAVIATISVGTQPTGVAVDSDSVWVANANSGTVSRINKANNTVIATITVGSYPHGVAVDSNSVWVSNFYSKTVSRINKANNAVIATIPVGSSSWGVSVDSDSVWVSNFFSNTVSRINKANNAVIATISVDTYPAGIFVDSDSVWVATGNAVSGTVSRINKANNTVIATTSVGVYACGISVDSDSVWVTNFGSSTVSRINKANNAVIATISVGANPYSFGDMTGYAYDMFFTPLQISNCTELQAMQNGLGLNYVLANDIDCSDTVNWNSGAGFVPISNFTGTFDGQNHKITGLFINRPSTDNIGLFGKNSGTIKNVGLVDVNITGRYDVGGLVGANIGAITNSYSTGSVIGTYSVVGGLVGENYYGGAITNCYATASVTGVYHVGGLVGANIGAITNSYATGNVSGRFYVVRLVGEYVGGLVGANIGAITNSYATGNVSGTAVVGGLVGYNDEPGVITNSHWDINTSGQTTSAGGTGKTTAEMKQQSTFVDWDFATIWAIKEGISYPYFSWQVPPVLCSNSILEVGEECDDGNLINGDGCSSTCTVEAVTCPSGMVSYWKFDEGSGTTAHDSVGANDGALINGPVWTTEGKVGNALSFGNGVNSVVTLPIAAAMSQQANFTISAWVKADSVSGDNFIYSQDLIGGATIGFLRISHGQAQLGIINDRGTWEWQFASGMTTLSTGVWYQLVGVLDSSAGMTIYINGVVDGSNANYLPLDITPGSVEIGAFYYQGGYNIDHFNGLIDEVAIYNRALSAEEIAQHYQDGLDGKGYCVAVSDTTAPVAPDAPDLQAASDTGFSSTDNITNDNTPSFDISGLEPNSTVTVYDGSNILGTMVIPDGYTFGTFTPASPMNEGIYVITATQTDAAGNVGPLSQAMVPNLLIDTTPPVIAAHADVTVEATSSAGAVVTYELPTATDNYDANVVVTCTPVSGSTFPLGDTTVTCTATDLAGNNAVMATRAVHVNVTVEAACSAGAVVTYELPTVTDNYGASVIMTCTSPPGSTFPLGDTTVTCTATDSSGIVTSTTFVVHVTDTTAPVIVAHDDITAEATSHAGAVVTYTSPTATDNYDASVTVSCAPASGSTFALGTTLVTCSATDVAGNHATSTTFNVLVQDTTKPVITLTGDNPQVIEVGSAYSELGATVSDNYDTGLSATINTAAVNTAVVGSYTVTYNVSDANHNAAIQVVRTVHIVDTTPPVIAAHTNVIVEATSPAGAVVNYVLPTATDNYDTSVAVTCTPVSGSIFSLGDTTVTCNAHDNAGNVAIPITFKVSVQDKTAPTITIITPVPYGLYTVGTALNFSATDDQSGIASVVGDLVNTLGVSKQVASGFTPEPGVYSLVVTATDKAGNIKVSDTVNFVVYDPSGGFAIGGGWFYPDSESNLSSAGKANFGFNTKYKDSSSTGNLEFQYKSGPDINLKSTTIDWLVISETSAQFQGTGTINGTGLYTFRVMAKDNAEPGIGADHFDIRIWGGTDTSAGIVYKAKNTLSGGNIMVHKK